MQYFPIFLDYHRLNLSGRGRWRGRRTQSGITVKNLLQISQWSHLGCAIQCHPTCRRRTRSSLSTGLIAETDLNRQTNGLCGHRQQRIKRAKYMQSSAGTKDIGQRGRQHPPLPIYYAHLLSTAHPSL